MKNKKIATIICILFVIIIAVVIYFILTKNTKEKYIFDFFDGYTPGSTYKGEINFKTGDTDIKIIHACSLLPEKCTVDNNEYYTGTLEKEYLDKIKDQLEKTDYKDNEFLIRAIAKIIQGDKLCVNEENDKMTCKELGKTILETLLTHDED